MRRTALVVAAAAAFAAGGSLALAQAARSTPAAVHAATPPTVTPAVTPADTMLSATPPAEATGLDSSVRREVFTYRRDGRRDPFLSLMTSSEVRPLISDLRLVGVAYDAKGANSVAILRDVTSQEQWRVKVGQVLGRMRVARISPKAVSFTIEEFGYSRQAELAMGDSTQARKQ